MKRVYLVMLAGLVVLTACAATLVVPSGKSLGVGTGKSLSVASATAPAGTAGSRVNTNSESNYLTAPYHTAYDISNTITIAAHVQFTALGGQDFFVVKNNALNGNYNYAFYKDTDNKLTWYDSATGAPVKSTSTIPDTLSHHVAVTKSGTTLTFYLDGSSIGTATVAATLTTFASSHESLYIGVDPTVSGTGLNGRISFLTMWNTALSAGNVALVLASATPQSIGSGNVAAWCLCRQADLVDRSTSGPIGGNDLVITGTFDYSSTGPAIAVTADTQSSYGGVLTPAPLTPHFPHISMMSWMGRHVSCNLAYGHGIDCYSGGSVSNWQTLAQFAARHTDLEINENTLAVDEITEGNTTLRLQAYTVSFVENCTTGNCYFPGVTFPESAYIHYRDTTQYRFDGGPILTIPGCAGASPCPTNTRAITGSCDVGGPSGGYLYNMGDASFRSLAKAYFLAHTSTDYVYIDCVGTPTDSKITTVSGGTVQEYAGSLALMTSGSSTCPGVIDPHGLSITASPYAADFCTFLQDVTNNLAVNQDGIRRIMAAPSTEFQPSYVDLPQSSGGMMMAMALNLNVENGNPPLSYSYLYYKELLNYIKLKMAQGQMVNIDGTFYNTGGDVPQPGNALNWNAGNYLSSKGRFRMTRFTNYLMHRQPVGSPGRDYFGITDNWLPATLEGGGTGTYPLDVISQTMADCTTDTTRGACQIPSGFQADVGVPINGSYFQVAEGYQGFSTRYFNGFSGPATNSMTGCAGVPFYVYGRLYTKALVLFRSYDGGCNETGASTSLTITLDKPRLLIREDGTTASVSSVTIREMEGLALGNP